MCIPIQERFGICRASVREDIRGALCEFGQSSVATMGIRTQEMRLFRRNKRSCAGAELRVLVVNEATRVDLDEGATVDQ